MPMELARPIGAQGSGPRTKTSPKPLVSPPTKLEAKEWKATKRPSAEIEGEKLARFPCAPAELTLTRFVLPVLRSRTKTSLTPLVSPPNRFESKEQRATKRPPAEIEARALPPFPSAPAELTLTRFVLPVLRSRTKTSMAPLLSPPNKF